MEKVLGLWQSVLQRPILLQDASRFIKMMVINIFSIHHAAERHSGNAVTEDHQKRVLYMCMKQHQTSLAFGFILRSFIFLEMITNGYTKYEALSLSLSLFSYVSFCVYESCIYSCMQNLIQRSSITVVWDSAWPCSSQPPSWRLALSNSDNSHKVLPCKM